MARFRGAGFHAVGEQNQLLYQRRLPHEDAFACRGLFSGMHYTFTFEAEDGTKVVKNFTPSKNYTVDSYLLGEFTLNNWE